MEMTIMLVHVDTFVTFGIVCEITAKPCGMVRHPDYHQRRLLLA
jgi:hypothetical protein